MRAFQFPDLRLQRDNSLLVPLDLIDFSSGWYMAAKFRLDSVYFLLDCGDLSAQVFQHLFCSFPLFFFTGHNIQPLVLFLQVFVDLAQKRIDLDDAFPGVILFNNVVLQTVAEPFPFSNLSGDVAKLPPGACLFINLDLLRQSGNRSIESSYVIGLTHQRVQAGMDAACSSIN